MLVLSSSSDPFLSSPARRAHSSTPRLAATRILPPSPGCRSPMWAPPSSCPWPKFLPRTASSGSMSVTCQCVQFLTCPRRCGPTPPPHRVCLCGLLSPFPLSLSFSFSPALSLSLSLLYSLCLSFVLSHSLSRSLSPHSFFPFTFSLSLFLSLSLFPSRSRRTSVQHTLRLSNTSPYHRRRWPPSPCPPHPTASVWPWQTQRTPP